MPPEKILPEVGAPQPDEQTKSPSPELQTPPSVADLGNERSAFSASEAPSSPVPVPLPTQGLVSESSGRNSNYITAVDFEQLQADTYQVQSSPVISETTTEILGVDAPVRPNTPPAIFHSNAVANSPPAIFHTNAIANSPPAIFHSNAVTNSPPPATIVNESFNGPKNEE